jgi:dienelactone hydrolase
MKANLTIISLLVAVSAMASPSPVPYATASDGTILHWRVQEPVGGGKHPVVLTIPGGGFKNLFSIPPAVSQDLLAAGYVVFDSVEYRLAPPNKLSGQVSDGRYPDQTNDIELAAAAALRDSRCNGEVFAVGGSAGASHAEWLAAKGLVRAAVCLSPATQFDDAVSLQDGAFRHDVENYAPTDPAAASPDSLLTSGSVIMISAYQQDHMPAPQYDLAVAKLLKLGAPYAAQLVPGKGHSWDLWPTVKTQAISFLNAHRGASPTPTPTPTATSTPTATATATATPTPEESPTPVGIGIMALTKSDQADKPLTIDKLTNDASWTNPHVKGVIVRTTWARIEPQPGVYYLDWLNEGIKQAGLHNKKLSFLVTAGTRIPAWFCANNPTACVMITEVKGDRKNIDLPWHPAFQQRWTSVVQMLAQNYDGKVAVFNMGGFGRGAESYFVFTPEDIATMDTLAKASGYADGPAAWEDGAKWVTALYDKYFIKTPTICVTAVPFPNANGTAAIADLINDSTTKFGFKFGAASHGLTPTAPGPHSIGGQLPRTSHIGFECALPQGAKLKAALDHGIALHAEWIGVYQKDSNDPGNSAILDAANAQMIK